MKAIAKYILVLLKWTIIVCLFGYVLLVIKKNIDQVRFDQFTQHPWLLLSSFAILAIYYLLMAIMWHAITIMNGGAIDLKGAVGSWFASNFGKYVPGKIFLWAARAYFYNRNGISIKKVTLCFSLESGLQILSAILLVAVVNSFGTVPFLQQYRAAIWISIPLLLVFLSPVVIQFWINLGLRLLHRHPVKILMNQKQLFSLCIGYSVTFAIMGFAFFVFVNCFYPVSHRHILYLTSAIVCSGIAGILALFAPAGIGVREGVLLLALQAIIPPGQAALIVIASRMWLTIIEILAALCGVLYLRYRDRRWGADSIEVKR